MASSDFAADISKFVQKTKLRSDVVVRRIALDIFSRVVRRTPVDTGRARANWQIGINQLPKGTMLTGKVGFGTGNLSAYKIGDIIYIANNLPYIGVLEYGGYPNPPKYPTGKTVGGFSKQAPQGMVGVTMTEMKTILSKATQS